MDTQLLERLEVIRERVSRITAPDTAYEPEKFMPGTLNQHCGMVSDLIQTIFGGVVLSGKVNGERHLWNRLPDGTEVDLSSDQYGGDGFLPLPDIKGRVSKTMPKSQPNKRYKTFYGRYVKEA